MRDRDTERAVREYRAILKIVAGEGEEVVDGALLKLLGTEEK
jgi:hypothetical protein